jgi:threonine dehydrogenase-like Zn-dependent dehydrogenase
MFAPGDVRVVQREDPTIREPTDAVIRVVASCVCGSDLAPYRGISPHPKPTPMGHEYVGVVEAVGSSVSSVRPGQFVVGTFMASDNICENCLAGYPSLCVNAVYTGWEGAQAEYMRVPMADGALVPTSELPEDHLVPSLLTASDVLGTAWFGAVAAAVGPGKTVAVVGDGAVGLLAVLAARQLGAERIIAMSRHQTRAQLAIEFGATDIVPERGAEGVAWIKEFTGGYGAHSTIEAAGTEESVLQALRSTRPGGHLGLVGYTHGVNLSCEEIFYSGVHFQSAPAPVLSFLPHLIDLVERQVIDPGRVFDLTLSLEDAAEGYRAMDERRAIKALLLPGVPAIS